MHTAEVMLTVQYEICDLLGSTDNTYDSGNKDAYISTRAVDIQVEILLVFTVQV